MAGDRHTPRRPAQADTVERFGAISAVPVQVARDVPGRRT
jgi:hypothetical protein